LTAVAPSVPLIAEHDTWISVDPVVGCPAGCAYCYLGPLGLRPARPTIRTSPLELVRALTRYLAKRSLPASSSRTDRTPICIGNYTDMFMSRLCIDFLKQYLPLHREVFSDRPLCVVSKAKLQRNDLEELDRVGHKVIFFLSQSFAHGAFEKLEPGPTSTPVDTARSLSLFRGLSHLVPIHFYRPVTRQTVPDMDTARAHLLLVKDAGAIASVAVGLKHGPGLPVDDLSLTDFVGDSSVEPSLDGEILDDGTRTDILKAAKDIDHPLYFNTSCAVALATGKPEGLGTWRAPMRQLRCDPCSCPAGQRRLCDQARADDGAPSRHLLAIIQEQLDLGEGRVYWDAAAHAVRIKGTIRQNEHNRLMHLTAHSVVADRVIPEEAWLGVFATVLRRTR
jgi:hypothetical protein